MWGLPMQVLVRRELEEAAKVLGERIRTNDASPEVLRPLARQIPKAAGTKRRACKREVAFRLLLAEMFSFQCGS